jgi:hypothetical protein
MPPTKPSFRTLLTACFLIALIPPVARGDDVTPLQSCLARTKADWNKTEQAAWTQVCIGSEIISFPDRLPEKLRPEFLQALSTDPTYSSQIHEKQLHFRRAVFDEGKISYMDLNQLILEGCVFDDLTFINPTVRGILSIGDSTFGTLRILSGKIGRITLHDTHGKNFNLAETDSDARGLFTRSSFDTFAIERSHYRSDLYFHDTHFQSASISQTIVDGSIWLDVGDNTGQELNIADSRIGWTMGLGGAHPPAFSKEKITNTLADTITVALPPALTDIQLSGVTFAQWPNDLSVTTALLKRNAVFDPRLFDQISRAYKSAGQYGAADEVTFLKKQLDLKFSEGFARFFLFMSLITVGYGLWPTLGFAWFGALIVIGYFVFRSGEHKLLHDHKPRSWLVFSLDTIIPVINLDAAHEKVAFKDWRQYFLYGMRLLSAALVFLVAKILGDIITGY